MTRETYNGFAVNHSYNRDGLRTGMTSPAGAQQWTRDPRGLVTQLTAPEGNYAFQYDALGRRVQLDYPSGTTTAYSYGAAGDLTGSATRVASTEHRLRVQRRRPDLPHHHQPGSHRLHLQRRRATVFCRRGQLDDRLPVRPVRQPHRSGPHLRRREPVDPG